MLHRNNTFFLVVLLFFISVNCNETNQTDDKLIHTQIIFRHGDRTIIQTYVNDPYKDKSHWLEGFGQLINDGKRREYSLGQFLRQRYAAFLGSYHPDKLSIVSSDFDRTINSANLVLAAMFPPNSDQIWNNDLLWQPIAVHSIPQENDPFIDNQSACPLYLKLRKEYEQSPEILALLSQHQDLLDYLEEHTGQPIRTLENVKDIHEALDIEFRTNKTLPEWTKKVYAPGSSLEYLKTYWIKFIAGTPELKRLKSGFLLKEILDRFRNKTLSLLPDELMRIYSGHDLTIATLLNTLGIFELHTPPYGSSLMFELRESRNSHYIQLFNRNTTADHLEPMNITSCGGIKCPLSRMDELYSGFLASDFKTACAIDGN